MKNLTLSVLLANLITLSAFAQILDEGSVAQKVKTTEKVLLSCEQDEGDQWYQIAIRKSAFRGKGLEYLLIKHNEDDQTATLLTIGDLVQKTLTSNADTVYSSPDNLIKLSVSVDKMNATFKLKGHKIGASFSCFKNKKITYTLDAFAEPKISIGN